MIVVGGALGSATYIVDNFGGQLPPGMTLGSDGTLSGTPTQAGAFGWIVSATDSQLCMHSAQYYLTVDPNPEAGTPEAGSAADAAPDAGAGSDAGGAVEAGSDGGPSGNDAASGTDAATGVDAAGPDAATGVDAGTGVDAAGADAVTAPVDAAWPDAATGTDAGTVDAGTGQTNDDALAEVSAPGDDASGAALEAGGDDSSTQTTGTDANSAPDSGAMGTTESANASAAAGCGCRQAHEGPSWRPLAGIAIVVLAARRRRREGRGPDSRPA
jgi:MYXO-CTERM domain-containing protein